MARIGFLKKPFEMAKSSQSLIERLLEINLAHGKLHVPITLVFTYFGLLYNIIVYEVNIRKAIQQFTLARFELLFPSFPRIEGPQTEESVSPTRTARPIIPLLFNISIFQTALQYPIKAPSTKEELRPVVPLNLAIPELPYSATQRAAIEQQPETILGRAIMLQSELVPNLFARLEETSSAFTEVQKQAQQIATVATESKTLVLKKPDFADIATVPLGALGKFEETEVEEVHQAALVAPELKKISKKTPISPETATAPLTPQRRWEETEIKKTPKLGATSKPAEHIPKLRIAREQEEEPQQATILRRVLELQKQMVARIVPTIEVESLLLESSRKMIPDALVALTSRTPLPDSLFPAEIESRSAEISWQEVEGKKALGPETAESKGEIPRKYEPSVLPRSVAKIPREHELSAPIGVTSEIEREQAPSIPAGLASEIKTEQLPSIPIGPSAETKVAPDLPILVAYVNRLPELMLEMHRLFSPAAVMSPTIARYYQPNLSYVPEAHEFASFEAETPKPNLRKIGPLPTSWITRILLPMLKSLSQLSAMPPTASAARRLLAETITGRVPSLESMQIPEAKGKARFASVTLQPSSEAIEPRHVPSLSESIMTPHVRMSTMPQPEFTGKRTYTKQEYTIEKKGKRRFYPEEAPSKKSEVREETKETMLGEPQKRLTRAALENIVDQRQENRPAGFIMELQKASSIYAAKVSDLAMSGPIRTTMLGELAAGVMVPSMLESAVTGETALLETRGAPAFHSQLDTSKPLRREIPEEESVSINVLSETVDEDLKDLERKIGRILSEQLSDSGMAGPFRTTVLNEMSSGIISPGATEVYKFTPQGISPRLRQDANGEAINLKVFAEAADGDLRELERKIRNILSTQISRYYGSSRL